MTRKRRTTSKACRRGWDLFRYDGTNYLRIEKVDEAGVFASDDDAIAHARRLAASGNADAKNAVKIHDRDAPRIKRLPDSYVKKRVSAAQNLAVAKSISDCMRQIDPKGWNAASASVRLNMRSLYVNATISKAKGR